MNPVELAVELRGLAEQARAISFRGSAFAHALEGLADRLSPAPAVTRAAPVRPKRVTNATMTVRGRRIMVQRKRADFQIAL